MQGAQDQRVDDTDCGISRNQHNKSCLQHIHAALQVERREGDSDLDTNDSSPGKARASPLREGLSATSVNVLHAVLHKAFDHAVRLNLLPRNICDVVSPPRTEEHEITALSLEQVQQLLAAAQDHHLEALFVLALMTGMRRGELLALKWQDVNFAESTLYVRRACIEVTGRGIIETEPKTAKGRRSIHLPPLAIRSLKKHRAHQEEVRRQAEIW